MSRTTLLATAGTLDGISDAIARFYMGERKFLEACGPNSWRVTRSDGSPLLGVRVFKRGSRFRFEMIA